MTTSVFKRVSVLILCVVLFLGSIPVSASSIKIVISPQSVLVNGVKHKFETYNIGGSNFFMLRDIAYVLKGSKSQFSVVWDKEKNMISVVTGQPYADVGGETKIGEDKCQTNDCRCFGR